MYPARFLPLTFTADFKLYLIANSGTQVSFLPISYETILNDIEMPSRLEVETVCL